MIDDDDCGSIGRLRIGRRNRSTRRKPTPVPLCPPQIPYDLTPARTRAATVGSRRLTAWAMAGPPVWRCFGLFQFSSEIFFFCSEGIWGWLISRSDDKPSRGYVLLFENLYERSLFKKFPVVYAISYHVLKSTPRDPNLGYMNAFHILNLHLFMIHFNIILSN
jgi:hypothetical protein